MADFPEDIRAAIIIATGTIVGECATIHTSEAARVTFVDKNLGTIMDVLIREAKAKLPN